MLFKKSSGLHLRVTLACACAYPHEAKQRKYHAVAINY